MSKAFGIADNQATVEEVPLFEIEEVVKATNNFHDTNKLGQGGFGPVYRVNNLNP